MTSSGGLSFLDKGLERSSLGAQEQDPSSMKLPVNCLSPLPHGTATLVPKLLLLSLRCPISLFLVQLFPLPGRGGCTYSCARQVVSHHPVLSALVCSQETFSASTFPSHCLVYSSLLLAHLLGLRSASPEGPLSGFLAKYA